MVVAGSRLPAPGYRIAASGFDLTAFSLQKRLNHQNVQRSDMTLRSRLAAGLVIIAIILVTPLVLAITSLRRLHDDATTLRDREFAASLLIGRLREGLNDVRRAELALLFAKGDVASRDAMEKNVARVKALADAATIKLPRRIPYHVAMELLFTGRRMDAHEAKQWGIVNEIVTQPNLMIRAREVAAMLAEGPPLVFAAIKEVVRETSHLPIQQAFDLVTKRKLKTVDRLYSSEDQKEGARAFAEKRKPVWKGR